MIKIILADNQAIFRTGAAKVLAMEDDFRIVAQCESRERLLQAVETFGNSIVIAASALKAGLRNLTDRLRASGSRCIIVAEANENAQGFLAIGFDGVVYRDITGAAMIDCVRKVSRGEQWAQPGAEDAREDTDSVGIRVRERLTPKEIKIVELIVQGCKNKEIATTLGTTEQVIKNYLRSVYDKTGVSDRLELALFTIHHRVLTIDDEGPGSMRARPA